MIVELAGLPGCGKSTLLAEAAKLLIARGQPCDNLRAVARAATAEVAKGKRFLRGKPERANLYGAIMALDAPNGTARALFDWSEGHPSLRLWNMEMLAQLWYATAAPKPGTAVLLDEGITHRLAVSALLASKTDEVVARLKDGPPKHGVVFVDCPPELAIARCDARPRGAPPGFAHARGGADLARFSAFAKLLSECDAALTEAQVPCLALDARRPVADLAECLADWVVTTLPNAGVQA